ncbi:TTN [Symbiodinium sp. CCMP2592]|nr:TTN [Symbiodinium sp. CCMP2592]
MAIDPGSGLILSVTNMLEPENNEVAKAVLNKVISRASNLNCVIYDKMCVCQKAFSSDQNFAKVKYWCVDRFHAKAHGDRCPCSPLLHRRLDLRLRDVNTSIAEQTFSWFRGYASSFNTKNADTHIFYVLLYVKKHNLLVRKDYIRHLNPFSARAKASKSRHVLTRPSSKKYHCRRPAASGRAGVVYKKPSKKVDEDGPIATTPLPELFESLSWENRKPVDAARPRHHREAKCTEAQETQMDDAGAEEEREAQKKHKELAEARAAEEAGKQRQEQAAAAAREKQEELAKAAEEVKKRQEELTKAQAAEEARKKQEELAKALAEEAKKKQEELAKAAAEEARKKQEELATLAAEEARKKQKELAEAQAEEARKKQEELAKAAAEEAKKKQKELAEAQAAEEAKKKQKELAEAQARAAEAREKQEELAKAQAAEEARKKQEELAKAQAAEEAREKQEELAKAQAEEAKKKQEELAKAAAEEARKKQEELATLAAEEARKKQEELAEAQAAEETRKQQEELASLRRKKEQLEMALREVDRLNQQLQQGTQDADETMQSLQEPRMPGGASKEGVIRLFAAVGFDTESFVRKYSATTENSREMEVAVDFEFLTKKEMADDHNMTESDIAEVVAAAEVDPGRFIRKHPFKKGVLKYYTVLKIYGHKKATTKVTVKDECEGLANTDRIDVDVDMDATLNEAHGETPANLIDAGDGVSRQPASEELSKLLKRFQYPEIQEAAKPSTLLAKAILACQKRLKKLEELMPDDKPPPPEENVDDSAGKGSVVQRMTSKLLKMYTQLDESCDRLIQCQTDGVVDGYDDVLIQSQAIHYVHWLNVRASAKRKFAEMSFSECPRECPGKCFDHASAGSHHRHNNKGHSYLSRFLIAAVPSKLYKKNDGVMPGLLKMIAQQLQVLFEEGLVHSKSGSRLKFVFIGVKGDAEWHWEAAGFTRSYHKTGSVNYKCICPYCLAGAEGYSYTDVSDSPAWLQTVGVTDPWDATPPLNEVPYASTFAAGLYKLDVFHVLKFGVFRDTVGSSIVRLAFMRYWDTDDVTESCGVPERLNRAFAYYSMWCLAQGKNHTLKRFSRANMSYDKNHHFAEVHAKGSEVILLMTWLSFQLDLFLREPKDAGDVPILKVMKQMLDGGLTYVGIMHSHGTWLPHSCACLQLDAGMCFARGYAFLANHCTALKVPGTVQRYLVKVRLLLERPRSSRLWPNADKSKENTLPIAMAFEHLRAEHLS